MATLSLSDAHLAYGHVALLDGAALSLDAGERARPDRPQRHRQVVAAQGHRRPRAARRRPAAADPGPAHPLRAAGAAVRGGHVGLRCRGRRRRRGARGARALRSARDGRRPRCAADADRDARRLELGAARRLDPGPAASRRRPDDVRAVGRHAQARRPGAGARRGARRAAPRRADEPPRPRFDRLARGAAERLSRQRHRHQPRPCLPRRRVDPHRRARPRRSAQLPRQLRRVRGAQGRAARRRGARRRPRRQAPGPGGGLGPQGRRGATDAQRRPGPAPRGAAGAARGAARHARPGPPRGRCRRAQRQDRRRAEARVDGLRHAARE